MENSMNLEDCQQSNPLSSVMDYDWQLDNDLDFDKYLHAPDDDLSMENVGMANSPVGSSINGNGSIDPNLLDDLNDDFMFMPNDPEPQNFTSTVSSVMDARDIFNQGTSFPFPQQENVSAHVEKSVDNSSDLSAPQSKAASAKSATAAQPSAPQQVTKRKRVSKKKKRTPREEQLKREKFLERNRGAAAKCRENKKQYIDGLVTKADEVERLNGALNAEVLDLKDQVAEIKAILACHVKDVPGHCHPSMTTVESMQAVQKFQARHPKYHNGQNNGTPLSQLPNSSQRQAFLPPQSHETMVRQRSGNPEHFDLSWQESRHMSPQGSGNIEHLAILSQQSSSFIQTIHSTGHARQYWEEQQSNNGFVPPPMQLSKSWPGTNSGHCQPSHQYYPPGPPVFGGGMNGGGYSHVHQPRPFHPVSMNGVFNQYSHQPRPVSQGGLPSHMRQAALAHMTRPRSAPQENCGNRLSFVFENPANKNQYLMQRSFSGDSRGSGDSFKHDSGVSNMGSPPEKAKVETPPKDEGFEGIVHDNTRTTRIQTQTYRGPHPPLISNPQIPGGMFYQPPVQNHFQVGPADLQNPLKWLQANRLQDASDYMNGGY
jgi:hypothetical protein